MVGIQLLARAKINLGLKILGRRIDGYHELDTRLISVGIADKISFKIADNLEILMDGAPATPDNTAVKAYALCKKKFGLPPVKIETQKHIPFSAGLGGSSADAAGVLFAVSKVFGIPLPTINALACGIGADVPFMLKGGAAHVTGIGENVEFASSETLHLLIIKPAGGVSTAEAYKKYDELGFDEHKDRLFVNRLERASVALNPDIARALGLMSAYTDRYSMCGSGSAVFGVFDTKESARLALCKIKKEWAHYAVQTTTESSGIVILKEY